MNIIGFERVAESVAEKEAVVVALEKLNDTEALFVFEGTVCEAIKVSVLAEGVLPEEAEVHDNHDNMEEEHDGHSEFEANYVFACNQTADLSGMSVGFFETWPGIAEIETVYLGANQTVSFELTANSNHLDLTK